MELLFGFIKILLDGDQKAIILLLIVTIIILLLDRNRIIKEKIEKDKKLEKILENYHEAVIKITEAINSIKNVLIDIKTKL
ncbi:MAG: hypothetical protein NZZ41_04130 [Candidatus Dojkabacteria bacterium]|nr:hypothetical protein [Candidatus Dojkabacteria bacterium]